MDSCFLQKHTRPKRQLMKYKSLKRNTLQMFSKHFLYQVEPSSILSPLDQSKTPPSCTVKDCGCQYGSYCGRCTPRFR